MTRLIAALVMSMGWSIRGRYGHCSGAMLPGSLFSLFAVVSAPRPDWWRRSSLLALAGAIGWAFGGQTSYGLLVGYSASDSFADITYGYAAFVLAGAMWGGIGGGILGLALSLPRSVLNGFTGPLAAIGIVWTLAGWTGLREEMPDLNDTYWFEATSALAVALLFAAFSPRSRPACVLMIVLCAGWWLGLGVLTLLLGLQLNPPRSDSWAACLGVTIALLVYLWRTRNRAALMLACYGLLAGGIGFLIGDFVQIVQRAHWGPFQYPVMQEHSGWGKMEKLFGFIMGLGVAQGVSQLSQRLEPPAEDEQGGWLNELAIFALLVPMIAWNFDQNLTRWEAAKLLPASMAGLSAMTWVAICFAIWTALIALALARYRSRGLPFVPSSPLGQGQLLMLALMGIILGLSFAGSVYRLDSPSVATSEVYYFLCAVAATVSMVVGPRAAEPRTSADLSRHDAAWNVTWRYAAAWLTVPLLVLLMAWCSLSIVQPTSRPKIYRFPPPEVQSPQNTVD